METKLDTFTKTFFWFGYGVFLLASIPHIAAYFRHFDPMTTDWISGGFYWTIAVLLALVIDVSDVLVSIAVIKALANGAKWNDVLPYWFFIVLIMALSWLFNWQYNIVFGSTQFALADRISVGGWFTIGQINPIVGSAFQLLLLVYTGMAHKFSKKEVKEPKSLEELRKEAADARERATYIQEIQEANKATKKGVITRLRDTAIEAKHAVKDFVKDGQEEEVIPDITPVSDISKDDVKQEPTTDPLLPINEEITEVKGEVISVFEEDDNPLENKRISEPLEPLIEYPKIEDTDDVQEEKADSKMDFTAASFPVLKSYPKTYSWLSTSQKTATVNEIIEVTGHSKKMISNRLKDGTLKTSGRNPELVRISSVIEWLNVAPVPQVNDGITIGKSDVQELVKVG